MLFLLLLLLPGEVILGWDNSIPSVNKKIVLRNHIVPLQTTVCKKIPACSCEVKDNVNVTIAAGHTLKS
jgi:hypothetical protein